MILVFEGFEFRSPLLMDTSKIFTLNGIGPCDVCTILQIWAKFGKFHIQSIYT